MVPMSNSNPWLQQWHSNGIEVTAAELMYYRSKVAAFARHRQLHPPKNQTGALLSKTRGRGMEFDEVRHYQAGDDVRAIDWRVTARTGQAHTKLFREERERPVVMLVDFSASLQFGSQLLLKSVQACHLAAALAWQASQRGDRVGALLGHAERHMEIRPQGRQQGVLRVIHGLVEMQNQALNSQHPPAVNVLEQLMQRARQVAKPGTIVNIISDWSELSEATELLIQTLQRHCTVNLLQCTDPLDHALPRELDQQDVALVAHQGKPDDAAQQLFFAAGDRASRALYAERAQQQQQRVLKLAQQLGTPLRVFSAAEALENQWPEVMV
ncbi:hypothetical protein IDAT_08225 [Pseudidiomarina atlantica]|uniref:DUF58 domain-containing protein n=2 Tax=Pseudidiomarina atlantica TaxID=1517416 RepID=A0A094INK7_9GAMM|nr:hypothetical protein IDAT_08225 [Pseudidiomarina atlantica]